MMGRTHALAGVVMTLALQPLFTPLGMPDTTTGTCLAVVGAAGGAMLPDLDHRHATVARSLGPVSKAVTVVVAAISGGHRNGTHSILGVVVFTALSWWLVGLGGWPATLWAAFVLAIGSAALHIRFRKSSAVAHTLMCLAGVVWLIDSGRTATFPWQALTWGVGVGAFSHAILPTDALTRQGCPWLWPVSRKRFRLANLSTDHFMENGPVWWSLCAGLTWLVLLRAGVTWVDVVSSVESWRHTGRDLRAAFTR